MEIKQIKYFVEVVRQGGMTQASEHLYIAQSTISKAYKNIENERYYSTVLRNKLNSLLGKHL